MQRIVGAIAALVIATITTIPVQAQPEQTQAGSPSTPTPAEQARLNELRQLDASLTRRTGQITIPEAKVTLNLSDDYYFLGADDAKKVLTTGWGNPASSVGSVLGMILPAGKSPFDDAWGAVVTFERTGYVTDKDASKIKPDELLNQLREGEAEENRARQEAGFPASHLAGWAQPPSYDAAHNTLIWAKNIEFTGESVNTLNYDVRMLGREGVLSVNIVAAMTDLPAVRLAGARLQEIVKYQPGASYADYRNGDRTAEYGVAGLLAAGLGLAAAKKVGLLAILIAFAKKGFVLILAGLAAIGGWFRKMFGGGKGAKNPASVDFESDPEAGAHDPAGAGPDPEHSENR